MCLALATKKRESKRLVRPGGVMAQGLPLYELTPQDLASVVRTFRQHFAHTGAHQADQRIRIGLQADEGLNKTTVLGGCWHPSLGRLTRSELYFDLLCGLLTGVPAGLPWTILCHPSRISEVIGQARNNLVRLGDRVASALVKSDETLLKEELVIESVNHCIKGNIVTDLHYTIHEE